MPPVEAMMDSHPGRPVAPDLRSLLFGAAEASLTMASETLAAVYLPLLAIDLGATPLQVSLVVGLPLLTANALQLVFAPLGEHPASRKRVWLWGSGLMRALWVPLVLLPVLPLPQEAAVELLVVLSALRGTASAVAAPAWTGIMADLTDPSWRGRYFGARNLGINLASFLASLAGGLIVDGAPGTVGYAGAFGLALVLGVMAHLSILPVRVPVGPDAVSAAAAFAWRGVVERGLRPSRWPGSFRRYTLFFWVWTLATFVPGSLYPIYFTDHLEGSRSLWGMANAATYIGLIVLQRWWGRLSDSRGHLPVLVSSGVATSVLAALWPALPHPQWLVPLNFLAGIAWSGYNLAAFNLLLEWTPDEGRPTFVSVFNAGAGVAAAAGPILGSWCAGALGIPVVMVGAALLRVVAALALRGRGPHLRTLPISRLRASAGRPW
ncbi:MFS transporter [Carboxydochorda subterranea]|uniref:MFS transporter n=1 Tax=Carboxydichorda subterranea TaxID=3109565 RepID=A0ABZ1BTK5_9FIRM|nr:MFS transporter [Limnochorda sp. L945t]WRP16114.1 MFS transporter [Limnochorda sp. L945t]